MTDLQPRSHRRTAGLAGAAIGVLALVLAGTFAGSAQAASDKPSTKQTVQNAPVGCDSVPADAAGTAKPGKPAKTAPEGKSPISEVDQKKGGDRLPACMDVALVPVK